jgi:hypothetical protein
MSLFTVAKRLQGKIAGTSLLNAQDAVTKALGEIYDTHDWSFQKGVAGWLCPGMVANNGSSTTTPYSNQIIFDATATAVLDAWTGPPLLTQLQYRNPNYLPYNIIGYLQGTDVNNPNAPFGTMTLDRVWTEPTSGPGQPFFIYQVYFPAPVADFRKFVAIQDPTDNCELDFWSLTQADLAVIDSQRTEFQDSWAVVPAGIDQRPGSATLGYQMFELWPHQTNYVPYTFTYRRRGPLPQFPVEMQTMTTPYPITEDMMEQKARVVLCEDAEANRDRTAPKGSGANWPLLAQMAEKRYLKVFNDILAIDLNLDGEAQTRTRLKTASGDYAAMNNGSTNRLVLGSYQ